MRILRFKDYVIRPEKFSDAEEVMKLNNELVSENADINRNKKTTLKEAKISLKKQLRI